LTRCAIMAKLKQTYPKFYLYSRLVKAKLFIDRNYDNNINLHNIAREGHFSKFHFIRLFKLIYGFTPHQYMIRVRIENAKELLRKDFNISDSCFKVGFDSITSFCGLFKKIEGKTPSQYQHAYRLRQENIKNKPQYFIPHCFAEQNGWSQNSNFREVI
jgi:AraC-like DNA-binding protein